MPKVVELDRVDSHLLALLQANARESAADLGRKLGLARTTVVARIARLERAGVIAGYGVRLGRPQPETGVQVFCGLKVQPKSSLSVLRALERLHEVQEVFAVSGEYDYVALLRCASTERLDRLLDHLGQVEGILETHSSVVLSTRIDRRSGVPAADAAPARA